MENHLETGENIKKTENIVEYRKNYYDQNKEKIRDKMQRTVRCKLCNKDIIFCRYPRHERTTKHLRRLNNALNLGFFKQYSE